MNASTASDFGSTKDDIEQTNRPHWGKEVVTGVASISIIGVLGLAAFFVGFGFWATSAPISGAALAPGIVVASGSNLRIQHFEGGIVSEILVTEGEIVSKNQPLFKLDPTEAQAKRNRLFKSVVALEARAERLAAERNNDRTFSFSFDLKERAARFSLENDLEEQLREFEKRTSRLDAERQIIDQSVAALSERIIGLDAQIFASREQVSILTDDIARKKSLLDNGLIRMSEVNLLVRQRAELQGQIGSNLAAIAEAKTSVVEANQRHLRLEAESGENAAIQLNEVHRQLADHYEQISAAENVLSRVIIRSPSAGTVVELNKNTTGSVVRQGEDLAVILPSGGKLIVEVRVSTADADVVSVGQVASLRFSTLNTRTTPEVPGTVSFISPDRVIDPVTNEPYFPARVTIAPILPDDIKIEQIFPGMPVETFIETGDRTFVQYIFKPASDSFRRAFREN